MRKGLLGHLEDSLVGFFGWSNPDSQTAPTPAPAPVPARPADGLDESVTALQSLAREIGQRMRADDPSRSLVGERPDLEKLAQEAAVHHRHIAEDIVALHGKLGTGLTREQLEALQAGLAPLLPYLAKEQGGLVERTYFHVLSRMLRETAVMAWSELQERMAGAGLRWPDPGGVYPAATPEEKEAARQRALDSERQAFLTSRPEQVCDRVFGLVQIWRASYPPRDSDLWFQQCLLGVASGRQLQLFEAGATLLLGPEGEEIKTRLRERAEETLGQTRDLLKRGEHTLYDVNEMLISIDRLASEEGPNLIWGWLEPRLAVERLTLRS